jgi:hypothetical protein
VVPFWLQGFSTGFAQESGVWRSFPRPGGLRVHWPFGSKASIESLCHLISLPQTCP